MRRDRARAKESEHRTADDARIKARTHTHTHICTHTRMYSIRNPTVYLTRGLIYMYLYSSSIKLTCFRHLSRITPPAGLHHGWWRRQIQAQECGLALSFLLRFGLGPAMRKSCVSLHSRHARVAHAHAISHRICWLASNNSTSQQCTWAQQRLAPAGFGQTTASTTVRQAGEFCSPRGTQPLQARMEGGTEVGRTLILGF